MSDYSEATQNPTKWAYDQACKALWHHRARAATYKRRALALMQQCRHKREQVEYTLDIYHQAEDDFDAAKARADKFAVLLVECVAHLDDRSLDYPLAERVHTALAAQP